MHVEVLEDRRAVGPVGEGHVIETDVANRVDQVHGAGAVHDRRLLVEDLVDPAGRGPGPLAQHDEHAEHLKGRLQHDNPEAEAEDGAHLELVVDHQVPTQKQHQGQAHLHQVLNERREPGAQVGVLDVGPLQPVSGPGQVLDLLVLGGEGLDHADTVDVFVDDGGHVGQPRLDEPRDREHRSPHPDAEEVDEGHGGHGHQGQRHVDREHVTERHDGDGALDDDARREGEVHLHRPDIRVGPGDELAGLDPVVERERHAGQVLIHDVAEVEFHLVGRRHQEQPGDVAGHGRHHDQHQDDLHVVAQGYGVNGGRAAGAGYDGVVERLLKDLRDLHLQHQADERGRQGGDEQELV